MSWKNSKNGRKVDAREVALRVINAVDIEGAYANIALAQEINRLTKTGELNNQDRKFLTELVYGTIKAGNTLDWLLEHYLSRPLNKITPIIRNILRLGMYQLFFLTKVPPSAACNQSVELAKKYGHAGTVKLVNAVLRNAARNPEKAVYPNKDEMPVEYLALKYFHPDWLVKRWLDRLGFESCEDLCKTNNCNPPLSIRTNTTRIGRETLLARLENEGVVAEPSAWTPEGIVCHEYPALMSLSSLQAGLFQVQDESSMLVGHILDPKAGEFIIDACGAPGGKSTHIASLMSNQGRVLSTDIYPHKLAITEENAKRLGLTIIETQTLDATNLGTTFPAQADRVLVDVPCSGLGVLRRKPDSRWRKSESMLKELPKLQTAILSSCAQCVKPGGILVYSTCTTEPEENSQVINSFLHTHPEFALEKTGRYLPIQKRSDDMVQLWPHIDGIDGFFIARMTRLK
ncbi:MAG TPA: 16S rRNA (cytosine(967)-C(5))-methyltransferase RsmB [Methylomusa anaerophila]|uniref:16S rRNA (cytosine(967)-C(5))-methyltransferase n=1 Tax=Methylomusa anaerophila TaxID=1930071 RepID=A0A348APN3_9FIRM|nr:16S rRNA (cytosine(967)-C(5))-methyltransferase RsmB [Methylomusa anaerophila]BBB93031.1 ribosomal RNA small subunit methyltransferase B [Methylomusa anaerophila]HML87135.1 16S rRNA (cytosine(967)-C(5))-methyltransferase RsmB [Methylomusa anaerophila]